MHLSRVQWDIVWIAVVLGVLAVSGLYLAYKSWKENGQKSTVQKLFEK
jgi:hypothetical protein